MIDVTLTIKGRPITKKNSQKIIVNMRTGRPRIIPSKAYREYEEAALWQLKVAYKHPAITRPVNVCAWYWMPNRRGKPDLLGLEQATADILEAAGVVQNDVLCASWDGSRIMGIDRDNSRVEIRITEAKDVAS